MFFKTNAKPGPVVGGEKPADGRKNHKKQSEHSARRFGRDCASGRHRDSVPCRAPLLNTVIQASSYENDHFSKNRHSLTELSNGGEAIPSGIVIEIKAK